MTDYKNAAIANYLIQNGFYPEAHAEFEVQYLDLDGSVQTDWWSLQGLWEEIFDDLILILYISQL